MKRLKEIEIIAEVAAFAAIAHNGQRRRGAGDIPYIVHPARVAILVTKFGGDWRAVAAAWLHDVIEDCPPSFDVAEFVNDLAISASDKQTIIMMVAALTKNPAIKLRRKRLMEHINMIQHAPSQTVLVKICDRIDNLVMNKYEVVEDRIDGMEFHAFLKLYLEETRLLLDELQDAARVGGYYYAWMVLSEQLALSERNGT